jgi:hypothetical protein
MRCHLHYQRMFLTQSIQQCLDEFLSIITSKDRRSRERFAGLGWHPPGLKSVEAQGCIGDTGRAVPRFRGHGMLAARMYESVTKLLS